jgi:hypothetical protein
MTASEAVEILAVIDDLAERAGDFVWTDAQRKAYERVVRLLTKKASAG